MNDSKPVFSIIIASLNSIKTLESALFSIIRQTFQSKEVIVMDGGSADGSVNILRQYDKHITHWESQTDRGLYHALNKGLKQAKGDWIYFLGGDDRFYSPQVLETIHGHIQNLPSSTSLLYGRLVHCTNDGCPIKVSGEMNPRDRYSLKMPIDHQAVFHHRSLFEACGVFDEKFKIISDLDHQLRLLGQYGVKPRFLPVTVAFHSHGGLSTRSENRLLIWKETEQIRRKLEISIPIGKRLYRLASAFFWANLSRILGEDFSWRLDKKLIKLRKNFFI